MNRRVKDQARQDLSSLLPAYDSSNIPTALLELATTLLVQSQSKAARLKPEEEPGRAFACSEIACHRLKTRLNLPKIESKPPCAPRTYKKLYQFLDRTLQAQLSDPEKVALNNIGRIVTPSKQKRSAAVTPSSTAKRSGKSILTASKETVVPADIDDIATPTKKRKRGDGHEPTVEVLARIFTAGTATAAGARQDSPEPEFVDAVETFNEPDDDSLEEQFDHDVLAPQATGRTGLGSLMESQFDWLNDQRRAEYKRWEAKTMRRIDAIERQQSRVAVSG